jgi:hypothetical protein
MHSLFARKSFERHNGRARLRPAGPLHTIGPQRTIAFNTQADRKAAIRSRPPVPMIVYRQAVIDVMGA